MLLKIFWNFWNSSRKKSTQKQPFSGVYKIDVLKKFANFTKKHQCWSHFLKKSPEIKRLQHRCFPVNFVKLLRTPFLQSTSGRVSLLKYFMFRSSTNSYLIVWSFSMLISKTTCPTPFLVSPFSLQPIFFTNEDFWTPEHEERSIQSNYQEVSTRRCFCRFVGEIVRYEYRFMK